MCPSLVRCLWGADAVAHASGMTTVAASIRRLGRLASTAELHAAGHPRSAIAGAVRSRSIYRVRQGWYVTPEVAPEAREAARVGGRVTCVSGLALHGCWTVPETALHVLVASNACRLRSRTDSRQRLVDSARPGVVVHWRDSHSLARLELDPIECALDMIACQPSVFTAATCDSLLRVHPGLRAAWRELVASAPGHARRHLELVDGICESGTETMLWHRMQPYRLPIRRQAVMPGIGRVDFLVGDRLVIEVDGFEYHSDPKDFEKDRHRDARLSARGYRVLRFSYRQVMFAWPEVEAAIVAAVLRGDLH